MVSRLSVITGAGSKSSCEEELVGDGDKHIRHKAVKKHKPDKAGSDVTLQHGSKWMALLLTDSYCLDLVLSLCCLTAEYGNPTPTQLPPFWPWDGHRAGDCKWVVSQRVLLSTFTSRKV